MQQKQKLSFKAKMVLAVCLCLFYLPGYFFLFKEIGKDDFSLPAVIIGGFFTLFGIFGHSILIFEKQYNKLEENKNFIKCIKCFFKIIGTFAFLSLGVLFIFVGLFVKPENIAESDLIFFKATLMQKPKFELGGKSSAYLNIYFKEFPKYVFEVQYPRYLHYNTTIEDSCEINDALKVGVSIEDYNKYIIRTKPRTFTDIHLNQGTIMMYFLAKEENVFYNPNINNYLDREDKEIGKYLWIVGIFPLLGCISIWLTEIIVILKRRGYYKIAERLEKYKKKKIM